VYFENNRTRARIVGFIEASDFRRPTKDNRGNPSIPAMGQSDRVFVVTASKALSALKVRALSAIVDQRTRYRGCTGQPTWLRRTAH
jgi:hypothetical protein